MANELRGKAPVAKNKDYMLELLFHKQLSDKEEMYLTQKLDYTEEDDHTKKKCLDNHGDFIAYKFFLNIV